MIIVSSRKDFDDSDRIADSGHRIRDVDLPTRRAVDEISVTELAQRVSNETLLLLVHGYNNGQSLVYGTYRLMEEKIGRLMPARYDRIIGYSWPGGDSRFEWKLGKSNADRTGSRLRELLQALKSEGNRIDVFSHSLGARVCLGALEGLPAGHVVGDYFSAAAAVDNECLQPDQEFFTAAHSCERLFVLHSRRDGVLSTFFKLKELDRALGARGPEDPRFIKADTRNIFVADCQRRIDDHTDYFWEDSVYRYMQQHQRHDPPRFTVL